MSIFRRDPIKTYQKNMRYSATLAIEKYKEAGERTARVEELISYTKDFAKKILEVDPQNEEAKKFKDFPESMTDL